METNADLATYGDAVIKLCFLELMLDKEKKLTIGKSKVESDNYLVSVVVSHYDLIKHIDRDTADSKMPNDYKYNNHEGKNHNPHKYIATAVEAMVGAIYKGTKDLNFIIELLKSWMKL